MKLYYTTRSPYARKARILADEKNIDLDYISVDFKNKPAELLSANPVGKIPVLILDDGEALCDSPLICEYLDGLTELPKFFPNDERHRRHIQNYAALSDGLMDLTVSVYMEGLVHPKDKSEKFINARGQSIERCLKYFEEHLVDFREFHYASVALVSAVGYIEFRTPQLSPKYVAPKLATWYDSMSKRSSVEKTAPAE